jgi:hypothetical protein
VERVLTMTWIGCSRSRGTGAQHPWNAQVADLLAELLPVGGAINGGTVRNRTRRVGERIARLRPEGAADPNIDAVIPAVVIGLDGGYANPSPPRA